VYVYIHICIYIYVCWNGSSYVSALRNELVSEVHICYMLYVSFYTYCYCFPAALLLRYCCVTAALLQVTASIELSDARKRLLTQVFGAPVLLARSPRLLSDTYRLLLRAVYAAPAGLRGAPLVRSGN
jgi:hypothetical protein